MGSFLLHENQMIQSIARGGQARSVDHRHGRLVKHTTGLAHEFPYARHQSGNNCFDGTVTGGRRTVRPARRRSDAVRPLSMTQSVKDYIGGTVIKKAEIVSYQPIISD